MKQGKKKLNFKGQSVSMAIPNSGRKANENNQSLADLMNECEDYLHQMDSQSKLEARQFNALDDNSDEMEFGSQPAGI